jgi:O-antigen/teichoic acid export membrane protein
MQDKQMYNKLAKDVLTTFTATIITTAMGFISSFLVAGLLGPTQQGTMKAVTMLPQLLYTFLNFGVESAIMYYGSRNKNFRSLLLFIRKFEGLFALLALAVGAAAVTLGSFVFNYYKDVPVAYLIAILPLAPILFYNSMQSALLRSENRFIRYNLSNFVKQSVYFVLVFALFFYRSVWVIITANYLLAFAGIATCSIGMRHENAKEESAHVRSLAKYGGKSFVSNIINFFNYRFDILMLTPLVSKAQLGIYTVAQSLSELIWMIPNSVSIVLLPRISAMSEEEKRAVALRISRCVGTAMLVLVAVAYFAVGLLPLVLKKYTGSILPFRILLAGTFLMTYNKILGNALAAHGRPEKNIISSTAGSAVNVALNVWLIPIYGILGAAIAGSISYGVSGVVSSAVYLRMGKGQVRVRDIVLMNRGDINALWKAAQKGMQRFRKKPR